MRKRFVFSGTVQGVGFRSVSKYVARKFQINGWTRNNPDGTVTFIAEGKEKNINTALSYLKHFFKGKIEKTDIKEEKEEGLTNFQIR